MALISSIPAVTATLPDGAERFLGLPAADAVDLRQAVRQGLPFSALEALSQQLELSPQQCALLLGIPARTVARRKEARQLNPQESDRLYRLARATAQAVAVLGSLDHARLWFRAPNRALACDRPLDLLDTDIGARQVEEVLLRLNYGIFS
jgi:putative toxin-antitoxin system antitoxin component (TIGR02293 family)